MPRLHPIDSLTRKSPLLGSLLDKVIHPLRDPKPADPRAPFTPPPPQPSRQEKEDDDDDGPSFPMDPALA